MRKSLQTEKLKELQKIYVDDMTNIQLDKYQWGKYDEDEVVTLHHGTTTAYLPTILQEGLLPRSKTNTDNWTHVNSSIPGAVYLTDKWHYFYAVNATVHYLERALGPRWSSKREAVKDYPAYVTVTIPKNKLIVDEDFFLSHEMERVILQSEETNSPIPLDAMSCIEHYGTAAYLGHIPPSYITSFTVLADKQVYRMVIDEDHAYYREFEQWQSGNGKGYITTSHLTDFESGSRLIKTYEVSEFPRGKYLHGVKVDEKACKITANFKKVQS